MRSDSANFHVHIYFSVARDFKREIRNARQVISLHC